MFTHLKNDGISERKAVGAMADRMAVAEEMLRLMLYNPSLKLLPRAKIHQLAQLAAETHTRDGNRWKFSIREDLIFRSKKAFVRWAEETYAPQTEQYLQNLHTRLDYAIAAHNRAIELQQAAERTSRNHLLNMQVDPSGFLQVKKFVTKK